jgi:hypothetical protein
LKNRKKRRFRKLYWLAAGPVILIFILVLFLHRPARYSPPDTAAAGDRQGQVSPYLTHELLPRLYNGAQRDEPFELVVTQKGINDVIAQAGWPKQTSGLKFSAPMLLFAADGITLMGTVAVGAAELIITIELAPILDRQGLLNLNVVKVKAGAVNITPFARVLARRTYLKRPGSSDINTEDLAERIARSLLDGQPFEPVFEIDNKKVRIERIAIEREKLIIHLIPVSK